MEFFGRDKIFTEAQLITKEPFEQFRNWFEIASATKEIKEPTAMCLATATKDGKPSCRMVLMKGYGPEGFKFCTNYLSRKGNEIEENPHVALNFYWESINRCVRIEGTIEKLSVEESRRYFDERPLNSRIGSLVSPQSQVIMGRDFLTNKEAELLANNDTVDKPHHWGGFIVIPDSVEFWQGQTNRIHDRIRFRKLQKGETCDNSLIHEGINGWVYERLAP